MRAVQAVASVDELPPLEDLRPLAEIAQLLGLGIQAAHRWRLHERTPLRAWRRGRNWVSTVAEARDFIARRTAASLPSDGSPEPIAPALTTKRRRQIEKALERCKELGC